ncbi:MAG: hypothetical protein HYT79_01475 [Elusimicrobia bacterium]|nr:hypothetical protein [Elusimicrobiota bacterium]
MIAKSLNIILDRPSGKYLTIAGLTLLSYSVFGYTYAGNPNVIQVLPFIRKIMDPALYPGDPYVDTLGSFPSLYPRLMAFLAQAVDLARLHLLLHIALKYLLLWTAYHLAEFLFARRATSWLACFLFALSPQVHLLSILGDEPMFKTALYQTSMSGPFLLLGILWHLKERYRSAFALVAGLYYINPLTANFILVLFAAAGFDHWRKAKWGWGVFVLLWLPWLLWYLSLKNPFGGPTNDFLTALRLWDPSHYFPSAWPLEKWLRLSTMGALLGFFLAQGFAHCRKANNIKLFCRAMVIMWSCAFIFGEIFPVIPVIRLQLFRSDIFLVAFGLIFGADFLRRLAADARLQSLAAAGLIVVALVELSPPYYGLMIMPILIARAWTRSRSLILGLTLSALAVILCDALGESPAVTKTLIALLLLTLFAFSVLAAETKKYATAARAMILVFLIPCALNARVIIHRIKFLDFDHKNTKQMDWDELQLWANNNAPPGAVFLTPPGAHGFRVLSLRSPYIEWIDGAAMHWAPGFEKEWLQRLAQADFMMTIGLSRVSDDIPIEAVIVEGRSEQPAIYENETFSVLKNY